MDIKQFRYSSDNLGYLVYGKKSAMAIDGGAVKEILDFVKTNELTLEYITNTHSHMDHTVGNKEILGGSDATFLDFKTLLGKGVVKLNGEDINVYHTPGHTSDSVIFHVGNTLITGDTLFHGKVGRCFSGDLKGFLKSVKRIMGFPKQTIIYAGHDYVEEYMAFIKKLEPDNEYVDAFLQRYNPGHVYSLLAEEFKIDPFLRFNDSQIISILIKKGLPVKTEYDRWESIMSLM